ncbi:MAG: hypothetical protein ACI976_002658 [Aureispira sp.]
MCDGSGSSVLYNVRDGSLSQIELAAVLISLGLVR